jgi:hypothetical protein
MLFFVVAQAIILSVEIWIFLHDPSFITLFFVILIAFFLADAIKHWRRRRKGGY